MRVCCLTSSSSSHVETNSVRSLSRRYAVYIAEIQKRLIYVGLSFLLAWSCAYTQKISLLYLMTSSLQQALPGEKVGENGSYNDFTPTVLELESEVEGMLLSEDGAIRLIFTDVEEAFYTLLSVSLFWCVLAWFPVLLYHALCFFQPGFYAWQSNRAWLSISCCVLLVYGVFQLVDLFVIPRLLSFFYSFEIERSSLYLHAEIKVVSYVSLYVFVYCIAALLLVFTGVWVSYRQRQIIRWLYPLYLRGENTRFSTRVCINTYTQSRSFDISSPTGLPEVKGSDGTKSPTETNSLFITSKYLPELLCRSEAHHRNPVPAMKVEEKPRVSPKIVARLPRTCLSEQNNNGEIAQYKDQRVKVWWGCLFFAALISPPEISSQLVCTSSLIVCSEISIWLAYMLSCRFCNKMHLRFYL